MDLIVTLDDATGAIYSAFLVEEEGTALTFRGLRDVVERHGFFCALYTDRGSHYFHTPKAGGKASKTQLKQVGRAGASGPRAHRRLLARSARPPERAFRILQGWVQRTCACRGLQRLKRQCVAGGTYTGEYRPLFAIEPGEGGIRRRYGWSSRETSCVVEDRVVGTIDTVAWAGRRLRISPSGRGRTSSRPACGRTISRWCGERVPGPDRSASMPGAGNRLSRSRHEPGPCSSRQGQALPGARRRGHDRGAREAPTARGLGRRNGLQAGQRNAPRASARSPARTHRTGAASRCALSSGNPKVDRS